MVTNYLQHFCSKHPSETFYAMLIGSLTYYALIIVSDLNECFYDPGCACSGGLSACVSGCYNLDGSFECTCSFGYALTIGDKICVGT